MLTPDERRKRKVDKSVLENWRSIDDRLRVLGETLTVINQEISAIHEDQRTNNNSGQQNEPMNVVASKITIPAVIDEYYAAENRGRQSKSVWEKIKSGAEITSAILLFIYVVATWSTLREIQKQTPFVIGSADAAKSAAETASSAFAQSKLDNIARDLTEKAAREENTRQFNGALAESRRIAAEQIRTSQKDVADSNAFAVALAKQNTEAMARFIHIEQRPKLDYARVVRDPRVPANLIPVLDLQIGYINTGNSAAENVSIVSLTCETEDKANSVFYSELEIPMAQRDPTKQGITMPAKLGGGNWVVRCDPTNSRASAPVRPDYVDILMYGRVWYTDFYADWHYSDFCIGGRVQEIINNIVRRCDHNNGSN